MGSWEETGKDIGREAVRGAGVFVTVNVPALLGKLFKRLGRKVEGREPVRGKPPAPADPRPPGGEPRFLA
ncbi:MAG: hypothetical protein HYT87_12905 [Nitrospirae bacterium]|nr:hypothetical protein [Nitrospirota bacterium]